MEAVEQHSDTHRIRSRWFRVDDVRDRQTDVGQQRRLMSHLIGRGGALSDYSEFYTDKFLTFIFAVLLECHLMVRVNYRQVAMAACRY